MAITLTFSHRVDSVLTNATSVLLSDPTGTFGVKRDDTDATVVADGTAMTNAATGVYTYVLTEPEPGLTYTYFVEWTYAGLTHRAEFSATGTSDASWNYADQSDVEALLGSDNLRIISNVGDDSGATDTARVQAAGEWSDAHMDGRFASLGYVTPLANASAGTLLLVAEANARLTAWKLNQARVIASVAGKTPAEVAAVMEEHRKEAERFFRDLSSRAISITADRVFSRGSKIEAYVPSAASVCRTWCQL